jgi:hypothetical protein
MTYERRQIFSHLIKLGEIIYSKFKTGLGE